jgi:hypothetical protein
MVNRLRKSAAHRRGTALVEMVLVVPLLAGIIALIYFFGWSMGNQQKLRITDRYLAWRSVYGGSLTHDQINDRFLDNKASYIDVDFAHSPSDTADELVTASGSYSQAARSLAEGTVLNRFPRGHTDRIVAEFPSSVGMWQKFTGAMQDGSGREGVEWRRGQAHLNPTLTDLFLRDVDTTVSGISDPGQQMGQMIRNLYLGGW